MKRPAEPGAQCAAKSEHHAQDCNEPVAVESVEEDVAEEAAADMPGLRVSRAGAGCGGMTQRIALHGDGYIIENS